MKKTMTHDFAVNKKLYDALSPESRKKYDAFVERAAASLAAKAWRELFDDMYEAGEYAAASRAARRLLSIMDELEDHEGDE
jgi:hypothetical protein